MQVHIFKGQDSGYGYTREPNGTNLPNEGGPWSFFKTIEMTEGETGRIGVNSAQALSDISAQGYHLTRAEVLVTRSTGHA